MGAEVESTHIERIMREFQDYRNTANSALSGYKRQVQALEEENKHLKELLSVSVDDDLLEELEKVKRDYDELLGMFRECNDQGALGRAYRDASSYVESWYSGEAGVRRRRKIHTGPNGGRYYVKGGKKVYVKRRDVKRRGTKKRHA